jgi:hypothetical protein
MNFGGKYISYSRQNTMYKLALALTFAATQVAALSAIDRTKADNTDIKLPEIEPEVMDNFNFDEHTVKALKQSMETFVKSVKKIDANEEVDHDTVMNHFLDILADEQHSEAFEKFTEDMKNHPDLAHMFEL